MEIFWYFWLETEMSLCMGLTGYAGENPGFLGGTNAI